MNGTSSTARYAHDGSMHAPGRGAGAIAVAKTFLPSRYYSLAELIAEEAKLRERRRVSVPVVRAYLAITWRGTDASHAGHTATLRTASACIAAWHPSHWTCLARTGVPGELTRTVRTECGLTNRAPASSERQNPPVSSSAASRVRASHRGGILHRARHRLFAQRHRGVVLARFGHARHRLTLRGRKRGPNPGAPSPDALLDFDHRLYAHELRDVRDDPPPLCARVSRRPRHRAAPVEFPQPFPRIAEAPRRPRGRRVVDRSDVALLDERFDDPRAGAPSPLDPGRYRRRHARPRGSPVSIETPSHSDFCAAAVGDSYWYLSTARSKPARATGSSQVLLHARRVTPPRARQGVAGASIRGTNPRISLEREARAGNTRPATWEVRRKWRAEAVDCAHGA